MCYYIYFIFKSYVDMYVGTLSVSRHLPTFSAQLLFKSVLAASSFFAYL